ncbi:AbiV family abortive infection protein [Priestia sp. BR_2]
MSLNSFKELQINYTKAFYNASELLEEAQLLLDNNKHARSYLLSHIAIEELARCIMLASAIMKFKIRTLDVKKLLKRQTEHTDKIQLAYSFVKKLKGYSSPLSEEDRIEIITSFANGNVQNIIDEKEINQFNSFKNASLYVDQYQNVTKTPSEVISREQATNLVSSGFLLKEYIELNKWHEGGNLIELAKKMNNDDLMLIKNMYFPSARKI